MFIYHVYLLFTDDKCRVVLEEVQRVVLRTGLRTDGPVSPPVLVLAAAVCPSAAPRLAGVLPAVEPVGTAVVGHTLELEGEHTALAC